MNLNNVDEEWFRRDRSFRIIGNDQVGYHVRACGNHRVLSDKDEPLKTLQEARNWLTEYYPGVTIHTSQQGVDYVKIDRLVYSDLGNVPFWYCPTDRNLYHGWFFLHRRSLIWDTR